MHYLIGYQLLKGKALDRNLFLLGNIAPDAEDGTLTGKLCSHFRRKIGNEYDLYPNIDLELFREKYINSKADAFTIGYYCHLISDRVWVKQIYPEYLQFTTDKEKDKKQRELLFRDLSILNEVLANYFNVHFEDDLVIPEALSIAECSHEGLNELLADLNEDFNKKYPEANLKIFNKDFILNYISAAVCHCEEEIEHIIQNYKWLRG
jgi:hypothetical protein